MKSRLGKRIAALLIPHPEPDTSGQHAAAVAGQHEDGLQLNDMNRRFSREMFAQLLVELPAHRHAMSKAFAAGDHRHLCDCVHQLLGAVAYCDAPELEHGLRELQQALKTECADTIEYHFRQAIRVVDSTLDVSGYRSV